MSVFDRPRRRPGGCGAARRLAAGAAIAATGLLTAACTGGDPAAAPAAGAGSDTPSASSGAPQAPGPTAPAAPSGPGGAAPSATATGPPPAPGRPDVVRLGPRDSGRAVRLKVGDRLEITLTITRLTGRWTLRSYPRAALRADLSQGTFARFSFVARATGTGTVTLVRAECSTRSDAPCLGPAPIDPTKPPSTDLAADYTVAVRVA